EEKIFAKSIEWTLKNLQQLFDSKNTPTIIKNRVFPIVEDVCLMGHSASGHTVVSYLNETCGLIKSLVLFDPVDGYDPFGFIKQFITHPPAQLPFVIPTLILRTEFDPIPKSGIIPACAPDALSNKRFYDSLPGPKWMLNFTHYGHGDFLDDFAVKYVVSTICKTCETDCDFDMYRTNIVRAVSLFYQGITKRNKEFIQGLENPNNSGFFDKKINILSTYKYNGYDVLKTGPFCFHS
ncbi:Chlorophyllase, partial [Brachionus plicatilis]